MKERFPAHRYPGHQTYVVWWPQHEIVKVGYTATLRYQQFVRRGGRLLRLWNDGHGPEAQPAAHARENRLQTFLHVATGKRLAFGHRSEAEPLLGGGGAGWLECFVVTPRLLHIMLTTYADRGGGPQDEAAEAMLSSMAAACPEACQLAPGWDAAVQCRGMCRGMESAC